MMPDNVLSSTRVPAPWLAPDFRAYQRYHDWELGAQTLGSADGGLMARVWELVYQDPDVVLRPYDDQEDETVLFSLAGIRELWLAFDANMRPAVAYTTDTLDGKLRWYDTTLEAYDTVTIEGARSVGLCLDDKRQLSINAGTSDILLFYLLDGKLWMRRQRDRFLTAYELADAPGGIAITRCGLMRNGRLGVEVSPPPELFSERHYFA